MTHTADTTGREIVRDVSPHMKHTYYVHGKATRYPCDPVGHKHATSGGNRLSDDITTSSIPTMRQLVHLD